ncbi:ammonium transporter [Rhizobium sp. L1K21]|uniref:ammonium transporter n=1 Tax=Rhizobium sp. L1K21 TaxID=2954933 RepID=UPI002091E77E|nr:ammonium transporter [Rhizobium sp. L1K21]MCO6185607.1 ammonium transporter [Rhizobium sp. L1K21]
MTWMLTAGALVMFMQAGFLLLEAGMVRSKNSINVAQKNLLDFVFSVAAFACGGFMIAFGSSSPLRLGFDTDFLFLSNLTGFEAGFFVFQVMFCGTAATIVSGAVAERMRLSAYVAGSFFLSVIIYPAFAHWAWGAALGPNEGALLGNIGFIDFAGSTVVHATGGWVALAACMVLGTREGRFDKDGKPLRIAGHSPVLATTGGLLLFIGWIGFNGGSTLKAGEDMAHIVLNTILAGGFGAVVGHVLGYYNDGYYLPEKPVNGMLGGLVAITAGCHVLTPAGAIVIGIVGGLIAIHANDVLAKRWGIDDAVGAIGVHGFAGVAGTIGLAFLAPSEHLPGGRLYQVYVQCFGSLLNFYFCFLMGYAFFWVLNRFRNIRISHEDEVIGLNITEHATRIGVGHVEDALEKLLSGRSEVGYRLDAVAGDEAEKLTGLFNDLMGKLETEHREKAELETLRIRSEEAERVAALSNATFEAIVMHKDGLIVDCNEELGRLLGSDVESLRGRQAADIVTHDSLIEIRKAIDTHSDAVREIMLVSASGEHIPVAVRARVINYRGEDVRVACMVDLRERKAAERDMIRLAQQDPLTGLANRAQFNEWLEMAVRSAAKGSSTALILVDLDRFKNVNDVHGHQAGDKVIKEAASRLIALAGKHGSVARLGGDEFAIIQHDIDFTNQAADTGLRIVQEMARPIELDNGAVAMIGASVGIALWPEHSDDAETLIARADIALYHSKNTGRSASNVFRPGLNELIEKRRALEADLEQALENGEFELYFQPRVDAQTLSIHAYEALIRWNHPARGLVSPADFIPVAEACGKIVDIGKWVFRAACEAERGVLKGARISVNVSPLQFQQKDFVAGIQDTLTETGADPAMIELELTESMLIEDDARGLSVMKMLKSLGIELALDDFGTGYSSLSYLSKYPFDTIKIDRGFVSAFNTDENAIAILKAIIGLGRGLGMKIVAEGVETVQEAAFLRQNGCDQLQGYLLGKPTAVDAILHEIDAATTRQIREYVPFSAGDVQADMLREVGSRLENGLPRNMQQQVPTAGSRGIT